MTRVAGVGLTPWHLSPFLRVAHAGPARSRGNPEPTSPRAGLASLVYVLTGAARVQAGAGTATRLRANDALLLDAGSGALVSVCPEAGPVELLRVWIDVPAGARDMRPRMALSRALPLYVAVDSASGAERARVRVVLGDSAPLRGGKPARAEARPLNALVAAGVFDVKISAGMSARIRLNSVRALVYVREGTANIGGRPVKKGSLAVLHGPPAGGVVIDADGDESCAVVIMQGEAMPGKVVLDAQGIAANTPRELRKRVKRYARGDMADVFVDEG